MSSREHLQKLIFPCSSLKILTAMKSGSLLGRLWIVLFSILVVVAQYVDKTGWNALKTVLMRVSQSKKIFFCHIQIPKWWTCSVVKVVLPVIIGNNKISLETDVADTDIPLLLSKAAMKKSSTIIDFDKDTAMMFGKQQLLVKTTSGHYAIPLRKRQQIVETCPTEEVQNILICTNNSPTKKEIIKLHCQL